MDQCSLLVRPCQLAVRLENKPNGFLITMRHIGRFVKRWIPAFAGRTWAAARVAVCWPTGSSIAGDTGGELAQLFMPAAEKFVGGKLFEILKA